MHGVRSVRWPWLLDAANLLVLLGAAGALLWSQHRLGWVAADDGYYAVLAEKLLSGESLHQNRADWYPGYVHLLNALAFREFGSQIVVLRYPLLFAQLVAAVSVYLIARDVGGRMVALAAAFISVAFGLVLLLHPTANWYCTLLLFPVAALLGSEGTKGRYLAAGLAGLMVGLRPLSGALVLGAIVQWEFMRRGPSGIAKVAIAGAGALATVYGVSTASDAWTIAFVGLGPITLTAVALRAPVCSGDRSNLGFLAGAVVGGIMPLILYFLVVQIDLGRLVDSAAAAIRLASLDFRTDASLRDLAVYGYQQLFSPDVLQIGIGLSWIMLAALPLVSTIAFSVARVLGAAPARAQALGWLCAFYSVTAVYYAGPHYLLYVAAPCAVVTFLAALRLTHSKGAVMTVGLMAAAVVLGARLGQPLPSGVGSEGRVEYVDTPFANLGLKISADDAVKYRSLQVVVDTQLLAARRALVIPYNPEVYFLARLVNPLNIVNAAVDLGADDRFAVTKSLRAGEIDCVVYNASDKYNLSEQDWLIAEVRRSCAFLGQIGDFLLYAPCGPRAFRQLPAG